MKKLFSTVILSAFVFTVFAQDEEDKSEEKTGGFKKEYLFSGGNINLSFFNGVTVLGASPQLGYSVTDWLDAGIILGFTYTSERDPYNNNKYRQTIINPAAFARFFPVNFLFASIQYEHNFINQKYLPASGGSLSSNVDANSLLIGGGYAIGRKSRNSAYYYFSVSMDIINNRNSPHTDIYNNQLPVYLFGFNIPLFQGGNKRGRDY